MLSGKQAAVGEAPHDLVTVRKIGDFVTALRMCLHRKYLAVDAETANVVLRAELKSGQQSIGIRKAQF